MNIRTTLFLFSGLLFENNLQAQVEFERVIDPLNSANAIIQTVLPTNDGGYFTAGRTGSFGNLYVVKTGSSGLVQWSKVLSALSLGAMAEPNMPYPKGRACIQTSSGDYIIAGEVFNGLTSNSSYDGYIMKMNPSGNILWEKIYGSSSNNGEFISSVLETADGGYAVAGYSQSGFSTTTDGYLAKFSSNGTIQWSRVFRDTATTGNCIVNNIRLTSDSGFILTGYDQNTLWPGPWNTDNGNIFLLKLDKNGLFQWSHCYGSTQLEEGYDVIQTSGGGYALTGARYNYNAVGYHDAFILTTTSQGNVLQNDSLWAVGITIDEDNRGIFISQESDSEFVVAGSAQKFGGALYRGFLMKVEKKINTVSLVWNKLYGQPYGYTLSAGKTPDGGFILGGEIYLGDFNNYLIKTDSAGNSGCGGNLYMATLFSVFKDSVRSFNVFPVISQNMNYNAMVLDSASVDSAYCFVTSVSENSYEKTEIVSVYPNPFTETAILKFNKPLNSSYDVTLYDVLGNNVMNKNNNNTDVFLINRGNLSDGIYFIMIKDSGTNEIISYTKIIIK